MNPSLIEEPNPIGKQLQVNNLNWVNNFNWRNNSNWKTILIGKTTKSSQSIIPNRLGRAEKTQHMPITSCIPGFMVPMRSLKWLSSCIQVEALNLPFGSKKHLVFHVSCLKKQLGSQVQPTTALSEVTDNRKMQDSPLAILARRMYKKGAAVGVQLLIHWVGQEQSDATQEDYAEFHSRLQNFRINNLENQVVLQGGNDERISDFLSH